ncbi:MAG: HPr family phosphocarrier protein [Isosphaeraceae bacterium]
MPTTDVQHQIQITDDVGLHLRPASQFVRLASQFESDIRVASGGQCANGKSILDLLILAAGRGAWLDLVARGADAEEAVAALSRLVASWSSQERCQELTIS